VSLSDGSPPPRSAPARSVVVAGLAVGGLAVVSFVAGCRPEGLIFYDVQRSRLEQCTIRSNGEFCVEPDQFAAPVLEAWGVELRDDGGLLHLQTETWVLDRLPDGADPNVTPRTATREQVVTSGDAGCVTTSTRSVEFFADGVRLQGTLRATTRIDGPAACGATPVGERAVDILDGLAGTP
jgi:hypothetical protein